MWHWGRCNNYAKTSPCNLPESYCFLINAMETRPARELALERRLLDEFHHKDEVMQNNWDKYLTHTALPSWLQVSLLNFHRGHTSSEESISLPACCWGRLKPVEGDPAGKWKIQQNLLYNILCNVEKEPERSHWPVGLQQALHYHSLLSSVSPRLFCSHWRRQQNSPVELVAFLFLFCVLVIGILII